MVEKSVETGKKKRFHIINFDSNCGVVVGPNETKKIWKREYQR